MVVGGDSVSFSSSTKNELSRIAIENKSCALVELAALVRMNGSIKILGKDRFNLKFATENAAIARRIFSILKELYNTEVEVMVRKNRQLKKNNNYLVLINNHSISRQVLTDVGFVDTQNIDILNTRYRIRKDLIEDRTCKRSYIRGSFLGGGSISNPEKTYHLEIVTNNEEHATDLKDIINSFGLNSKIVVRKGNYVVYLKEAEQIVDFLNIIGAYQALLKLEDIRVLKDVRNNINRIVNCETANLSKTVNASMRQVQDIETIKKHMGLSVLPDNLRVIAEIRLANKDASLKEIGLMLDPPMGKSGVNHRFRKIAEIANELEGV